MDDNRGETSLSFIRRFLVYQKERFPFVQHGIIIACFTFGGFFYSRHSRGAWDDISITRFCVGVVTSILFFFLLRIYDEFKDFEEDSKYRPYRAVPRGLVSLNELKWVGIVTVAIQIIINLVFIPSIIWVYVITLVYSFIMAKEFFVSNWLRKHPIVYMASHMVIMPFIDLYVTAVDWGAAHATPSPKLGYFFLLSFFNGMLIEFGRKIRSKEAEEEGVETYSAIFGSKKASYIWLITLVVTYLSASLAGYAIDFRWPGYAVIFAIFVLTSIPAMVFIKTQEEKHAKMIEMSAGIWTIGMYLALGAVVMVF